MAGAVLRFTDPHNGRWFETTTKTDGRFSYVAVQPSHYRLEVMRTKYQAITFQDVYLEWSARPLLVEIDLRGHAVTIRRQVLLAETLDSVPPAGALPTSEAGEAATVRAINERIAAAQAYMNAGDWDNARSAAKAATEIGPTHDLPWAWLANVYCGEAQHESAHADALLQSCVENYKLAIAIAPSPTYFNNLGAAYSSLNRWQDAGESFRAALQTSSGHDSLYHLNLGTALLKQSESAADTHVAELLHAAALEFSLAATTSSLSDAFYWKGVCELRLAGMGTSDANWSTVTKSLNQYLQVAPSGRYAAEARTIVDGVNDARLSPSSKSSER